jgi:hypothetical protein
MERDEEMVMSSPLGDVHPYRAICWIEQHCKIDTPDGLLPEDQELQIWKHYLEGAELTSEPVIRYLALMRLCGDGDVK